MHSFILDLEIKIPLARSGNINKVPWTLATCFAVSHMGQFLSGTHIQIPEVSSDFPTSFHEGTSSITTRQAIFT